MADLVQLATERAYDDLESAWLEAVESGRDGEFLAAAEALASQGEGELAATLLAIAVPPLKAAGRFEEALRLLRRAAELSSRPEELRGDLTGCLRKVHEGRPGFEAYLKKSGLADKVPLRAALARLEAFLDFPIGRHVYHAAGWGVGKVVEVDPRTGDVTLDFEKKKSHVLPIESAVDFLQRLPDDHIWALKFSAPQRLERLRDEAPGELVKLVIQSRPDRRATLAQVKQDLVGSIVSEKAWSKFWAKAKAALLHDPLVHVSDDARPVLSLRASAVRYADELREKIARAGTAKEALALAKQAVRAKLSPEDLAGIAAALRERAGGANVEAGYVLEDLGAGPAPAPRAETFLQDAACFEDAAYLKRHAERFRREHPGWPEIFAAALPAAPREVFSLAALALKDARPDLLGRTLARIVASPDPSPEAFLELARLSFAGRFEGVPGAPEPGQVFERLIALADRLERLRSGGAPGVPNVRPRVRALLEDRDFAAVRRYFQTADREPARHTYQRIMASHALDDEVREAARAVVVRRFPDILSARDREHFWEDGHIYATQAGIERFQKEFHELVNEKIPANARAIGAAAALGDLSENAEFTAALEERDQLVARADRMKKDLERARPLEAVEIDATVVAPGTRVELRNSGTGAIETYTILGPWDVDLERGAISYTAPLAQGLLGLRAGEVAEISLPGGERRVYEIARIERAVSPRR